MIPIDELIIGAVYLVDARNFNLGIWDGHAFQGLRYKMGDHYMFPEIHWDADDRYGTAKPIKKIIDAGEAEDIVKEVNLKNFLEGSK